MRVLMDGKSCHCMNAVLTNRKYKFITKLVDEIKTLKEHNRRDISQFRCIKEVRCIVNEPSMKAVAIKMDWSKNAKLFQCL